MAALRYLCYNNVFVLQKSMDEKRKPGRPKKDGAKVAVSLRLSPDVLDGLKSLGPGWQAMTDGMLREALRHHHAPHVTPPKMPKPNVKKVAAKSAVPAVEEASAKPFWSNLKKR